MKQVSSELLNKICGLRVESRHEKGVNVFEFFVDKQMIKTCFTYPKAKVFAEGVSIGKKIGNK